MSLPPIGFWSYTRDDDIASGGRLSALRERLYAQLKQNLGKLDVRLFQDVAAIPPGTEWQVQIESALREASFLIPILTPGLLHSPDCAEEIKYFRTLMEGRGRKDLILPICFRDVSRFNTARRNEIHDPALFDYLKTLHWVDFTDVETKGLDTTEIRERLTAFATRIEETLYRVAPPTVPVMPIVLPAGHRATAPVSKRDAETSSASASHIPEEALSTAAAGAPATPLARFDPKRLGFTQRTWAMSIGLVVVGIGIGIWGLPRAIAYFSEVAEKYTADSRRQTPASAPIVAPPTTIAPLVAAVPRAIPQCAVCPKMVLIPESRFEMGDKSWPRSRERPEVTVPPFFMSNYPITVGEYRAFLNARPDHPVDDTWKNKPKDRDARLPAGNVSYTDAEAYIDWLNDTIRLIKEAGHETPYRLPSEAEWESAARARSETAYFWGDRFEDGLNYIPPRFRGAVPATDLQANDFNLHGMLGLVWQWVADPWHDNYKGRPRDGSVWSDGGYPDRRILRGGSWREELRYIRAGIRNVVSIDHRRDDVGFRLARNYFVP